MGEDQKRNITESNQKEGYVLFVKKRFQEAVRYYDKILEINQNNATALYYKALCLQGMGNWDDAIKYYDRILSFHKFSSRTLREKANALYHLGKYEEAIKYYDMAIEYNEYDSHNDYLWYRKGMALEKLGKREESTNCYNKIMLSTSATGFSLSEDGEYEEAIKCFDKALAMMTSADIGYSDVLEYKRKSLKHLGRHQEALKCRLQDNQSPDQFQRILKVLHETMYYSPLQNPAYVVNLPFDLEVDLIKNKVTPDMQGDDIQKYYEAISWSFLQGLKGEGISVKEIEQVIIKIPSDGESSCVIRAFGKTHQAW